MGTGTMPWRQVLDYRRYTALLALLWTVLIIAAGYWISASSRIEAEDAALVAARSGFEKDMLYRRWAQSHASVYVAVGENSVPSPYLKALPERDIVTPSGKKLTLLTPAHMARQVFDLGLATGGPKAHMTSLKPVRAENAPDDWERDALASFERGEREFAGVTTASGYEEMRYMGALKVEAECMACHSAEGYMIGEVRGGISVSVPLAPYLAMMNAEAYREQKALLGLWVFGILGLLLFNADLGRKVREREDAEQALAKSERALREVLENVSLIAIVLDPVGKILFANDHFHKISGYGRHETLGRDWFALVHEGDGEVRRGFDAALAKRAVTPHHHTAIRRKDGRLRTINWSNTLTLGEGGQVSMITSIGEDVTERLKAEERMLLLATALDRAADSVILSDSAGRITYVNLSFCRLTSISQSEALSRPVDSFLAEGNDAVVVGRIRATARAGQGWEGRLLCRVGKSGSALCDVSAAPLHDQSGSLVGFVHVARDITERVAIEQRLAQAQRMEALGTLSGGIAHDFNNILTAIQGWAELTLLCKTDDTAKENIGEILSASGRAAELVRQILAFSRKGDGSEAGPMAPAPLVKEAVKLIRSTLPANITLKADIASVGAIFSSPTEMHRIIVNLCTNASHAMAKGGNLHVSLDEVEITDPTPTHLNELKPGRYVRLVVKDDGEGMKPEVKARIFEPFFTTKEEGKGTGMGLSVVHGVVASRQGRVLVDSSPGRGTTFAVYLPVLSIGPERYPAQAGAETGGAGSYEVLFVDDEHSVVRLVERSLNRFGHKVEAYTDPLAALEAFRRAPDRFDVLITDMTMPFMRGVELAVALRELRPDLPVILCTGYSEKLEGKSAAELGVSAVELKPLTPAQLNSALFKVVRPDRKHSTPE